jgi:hypothetical protein
MADTIEKRTELTPEEKAMIPVWVEKYTKIARDTSPANFELAIEGVKMHYERAHKDNPAITTPDVYVTVQSPPVGAYAFGLASYAIDLIDKNGSSKSQAGLVKMILKIADSRIGLELADLVVKATLEVIDGLYGGNVYPKSVAEKEARKVIKERWVEYMGGQSWVSFVARATFYRDVMHIPVPVEPRELTDCNAGWWWPHEKFVIITDRPSVLMFDDRNRLHSSTGGAIEWRDAFKLYFWHGLRIREGWVIEEPERLTVEFIREEANAEIRRAYIEFYNMGHGEGAYLRDSKAEIIDSDPVIGELYRVDLGRGVSQLFAMVNNSTPLPPSEKPAQDGLSMIEPDDMGDPMAQIWHNVSTELDQLEVTPAQTEQPAERKQYELAVFSRNPADNTPVTTIRNAVAASFRMSEKEYWGELQAES